MSPLLLTYINLCGLIHCRKSNGYGNEDDIKEMLKALVQKLDKAADADGTGPNEPHGYNVTQIRHDSENKQVSKTNMSRTLRP